MYPSQETEPMFKRRRSPSQPLTLLSAKSEIQGDLFVEGDLRVEGIIHGRVEVRGSIEVLASGLIEGSEISAQSLTNYGIVKVNTVHLKGKLFLGSQAQLEGDVTASALNVEPGARYVGYATTTAPEVPAMALPAATTQEFTPTKKQQPEIILGESKVLR